MIRNHKSDFVSTKVVVLRRLKQGQLCTALYESSTKNKNRDKRPFFLFLGTDWDKKVMHALSLNYLTKTQISLLFKRMNAFMPDASKLIDTNKEKPEIASIRPMTSAGAEKEIITEEKPEIKEITLTKVSIGEAITPSLQEIIGSKLYVKVIRPFMKRINKEIYRTYKITNFKNLRVVKYKWDTHNFDRLV